MTVFRQTFTCCCLVLMLGLLPVVPLFAAEPVSAVEIYLQRLEQENAVLQRQVRRLESQAVALREELNSPGAEQVIAGIGYIVGLFGVVAWFASRKKSHQE